MKFQFEKYIIELLAMSRIMYLILEIQICPQRISRNFTSEMSNHISNVIRLKLILFSFKKETKHQHNVLKLFFSGKLSKTYFSNVFPHIIIILKPKDKFKQSFTFE